MTVTLSLWSVSGALARLFVVQLTINEVISYQCPVT